MRFAEITNLPFASTSKITLIENHLHVFYLDLPQHSLYELCIFRFSIVNYVIMQL
jgi:hypothetical protein